MKKFLSIAVALVMVLSLSVVAFADTTVASESISASATLTCTDGVDFTDESLYLYIYFTLDDESYAGWGPAALCDSNWTTAIGYGTDYELAVNTDGYVCYALTDVAAAFAAIGADPADGVVLNWWGDDYATLTGVAVVSTSADAAVAETEETTDETEEAEATEEATEETTEEATEETTTTTSPSTGVALALVPMAIAGIAVVGSKKR
ncbi:MAG: hypothetical protein LUH56_00365 [Oscillospiraceae bacterium]|nr:hypothetical protein [Oscillospiraceae bacterium]